MTPDLGFLRPALGETCWKIPGSPGQVSGQLWSQTSASRSGYSSASLGRQISSHQQPLAPLSTRLCQDCADQKEHGQSHHGSAELHGAPSAVCLPSRRAAMNCPCTWASREASCDSRLYALHALYAHGEDTVKHLAEHSKPSSLQSESAPCHMPHVAGFPASCFALQRAALSAFLGELGRVGAKRGELCRASESEARSARARRRYHGLATCGHDRAISDLALSKCHYG